MESRLTRRSVAKRELASIEVGHWNQRSPARVTPDVVLLTWRLDPVADQPALGAADNAVDFVLPRSTRRQVIQDRNDFGLQIRSVDVPAADGQLAKSRDNTRGVRARDEGHRHAVKFVLSEPRVVFRQPRRL